MYEKKYIGMWDIKILNDCATDKNYKFTLMRYGFCFIRNTWKWNQIVSLEDYKEELEKYKTPEYLQEAIDKIDRMMEIDKITFTFRKPWKQERTS